MLSLEHADPERITALSIPRIRVLAVSRHTNKLRIGHLRGNRFVIKLRDVGQRELPQVRGILDALARRGVPNYFGPQRFGSRGDTWQIGEAIIRRDDDAVVRLMCGSPTEHDTGDVLEARRLFDSGDFDAAARAWPYMFRDCALICRIMAASGGNARKAVNALNRNAKKFFISAYQSWLFNRVLAERINEIDRLMTGDLAWRHDNTAVFKVEDAAAEQPRADRLEISATGPIFGYRMTRPTGHPAELEARILAPTGLTCDSFGQLGPLSSPGGRRPLRFPIRDPGAEAGHDDRGPFIELRFALPSGCYATSLLREICKSDMDETASD
jgi:tRNA pseudouridine13 synthase